MDQCVYHIQLRGRLDESEINEMSPLHLVREGGTTVATRFSVTTDQSGLIGLLRYLHGLGYALMSVSQRDNISS